jgi:predicted phosphodiesterase
LGGQVGLATRVHRVDGHTALGNPIGNTFCPCAHRVDYNSSNPEGSLRYLILSDIHSNLEAFNQCMEMARGRYEGALCLGDLVGYGPDPNAVVEAIRELTPSIIRGNHDKACSGLTDAEDFNPLARTATAWTREQLTAENLALLRNLPAGPVDLDGFQFVHGSPRDEDEYIIGPDQALPILRDETCSVVLFGHTHLQGGFMLSAEGRFQPLHFSAEEEGCTLTLGIQEGGRYLINPGSVGQPRDRDWRAAFAIFDPDRRQVEYYRAAYDLPATQEKMRRAGLPEPLITRLQFGR